MTQYPHRPRGHALIWGLILVIFLIELIGAAAVALWYTGDAILPGVQAMGLDLGGMTRSQAEAALAQAWQARTITVQAGAVSWTIPIAQLGYRLDAGKMAQLAYEQGRTPTSIAALLRRQAPAAIAPIWKLDVGIAVTTLRPLVAGLEMPPQDAAVRIVGATVEETPSASGQAVDLAGGIADLEQHAAQILADGRLSLTVVPLRPRIASLSAAAAQARQLLASGIVIRLYDPVTDQKLVWEVTREEIGATLVLQMTGQGHEGAIWTVDEARLRELLRRKSEALTSPQYISPQEALPALAKAIMGPRNEVKLRVYHEAREHVVKPGETLSSIADDYGIPYPWIQQANPGLGDSLRSGQKIVIPSQDEMIPLPPVENKRIIVSIKEQKLWAYESGRLKWEWIISTGIPSSPTSPGVFQVQSRDPYAYANNWDLWMPWFVGFYRPVPTSDFMNGFHGFPKRGGTQLIWTNSLGRPVTFGCVLTTTENAKLLYDWAEDGVIVEVRR
ncbi:MAG: L,D-transpeptidase family protein [Anaerolineae bacterium]